MNPNYPVYIISKGRFKNPLTAKALDKINVPYKIVVEPNEYKDYANTINKEKIIKLDNNFSKIGQGSIPVRNFVWEHSINAGFKRHWILDDNIEQFNRLNNNLQVCVASGTIFKCAEDFVDRYENIGLAGFQYDFFAKAKTILPPFYLNTRIYSCILIKNDIPFRWRGKYNEDTDLSLRVLKAGLVTILFIAFIQQKVQTMKMGGGNEDIYSETNNRSEFVDSLIEQHPDVVRKTFKFGRWHHQVNYSKFKRNRLVRKDINFPTGINNYGMKLIDLTPKGE